MIVLAWLKSPAVRWKTFVTNRVTHIRETTNVEDWSHISSKENLADLVSRGVDANVLKNLSLWCRGSDWLQQVEASWPECEEIADINEEKKNVRPTPVVSLLTQLRQEEVFTKFSSWNKLQRVTAYCLRFIHNCRYKTARCQGTLSSVVLNEATVLCLQKAQTDSFMKEKADLLEKGSLSNTSSLLCLNPFFDRNQLRVGGRLENSDLTFDQQHPMILPKGHHITILIVEDIHEKKLHASGQVLLSLIRQKFWIPDARNVLRKITQKCFTSFRLTATASTQLMGQLPEARVKPSKPFTNTGVDYSGPFYVKQGSKQSRTTVKCYVALFVCLSTKAIHLELVSQLST